MASVVRYWKGTLNNKIIYKNANFFKVFKTIRIPFCYFLVLTETEGRYIDTFNYQQTFQPNHSEETEGNSWSSSNGTIPPTYITHFDMQTLILIAID